MSGVEPYVEYGVRVADGPHAGMLVKTFRQMENAQWFIDNPSVYQQERLYLCRRTVWKGEWEQVITA